MKNILIKSEHPAEKAGNKYYITKDQKIAELEKKISDLTRSYEFRIKELEDRIFELEEGELIIKGVYGIFRKRDNRCMYVGESNNIAVRVTQHLQGNSGNTQFGDGSYYYKVIHRMPSSSSKADLREMEEFYIKKYEPTMQDPSTREEVLEKDRERKKNNPEYIKKRREYQKKYQQKRRKTHSEEELREAKREAGSRGGRKGRPNKKVVVTSIFPFRKMQKYGLQEGKEFESCGTLAAHCQVDNGTVSRWMRCGWVKKIA